ncbi:basic phospholipase A2 caudoxin-like [Uloborus diversus]|uniref:basic phospholipase A2 caudoxin-like n=1 Tax=Uloborus diversus TaxID=327109 RepID=UPI002409C4AA|nr:basic phospholipase A2 caudoxin-like [Uloborus diversus]
MPPLRGVAIVLFWIVYIDAHALTGRIRRRRDLLDLADMFDLVTGLDPTDYIPYGNWCGYGGQGKPIDLIDRCCEIHDSCYGESEKKCFNEQIHVVQYEWAIENETIICRDSNVCEESVCQCDREVVECISLHNHVYREENRFIRKPR